MIKLSIKGKVKPEMEKEFRGIVSLEQSPGGGVNLMMRSVEDDFDWFVLRLKTDGTFSRTSGLSDDIGLQIGNDGRIVESEE